MAWNNVYLSTPNPVGNYQGSAASTVLSDLSVAGSIDVNNLDAAGTVTASTNAVLSGVSASLTTLASSGITVGSSTAGGFMFLTVGASGLSLGIESGGSLYFINSAVSAA